MERKALGREIWRRKTDSGKTSDTSEEREADAGKDSRPKGLLLLCCGGVVRWDSEEELGVGWDLERR